MQSTRWNSADQLPARLYASTAVCRFSSAVPSCARLPLCCAVRTAESASFNPVTAASLVVDPPVDGAGFAGVEPPSDGVVSGTAPGWVLPSVSPAP